ncbi:MAG: XDD4 family exosortase-dependent surface protein [Verrucomicrobiia bacterium]|jgi:hypothetical protein
MGTKNIASVFVAVTSLIVATSARAVTFTATGPGDNPGKELKASATFAISNADLVITLSNDATSDPNDAADILTAIFFKLDGDLKLTPVSAQLGDGSTVIGHRMPLGFDGNVGGEWAYRSDLDYGTSGVVEGISAANLKWFTAKNLFGGPNLEGPKAPAGVCFGLTTVDDLPGNDKGSIRNKGLIQNSVVFVLDELPLDFALADISDVSFQYGTNLKPLSEISGAMIAAFPEPSTVALVIVGLMGAFSFAGSRDKRS